MGGGASRPGGHPRQRQGLREGAVERVRRRSFAIVRG